MAAILAFGRYLPDHMLDNAELGAMLGCDAAGIIDSCGIEQRRIAAPNETIADLAERASRHCLERADVDASRIGLIICSSGTSERRFPGPASRLAQKLGLAGVPAIDLPLASAGSLFGLALAAKLAPAYGLVLVAAAEKMSAPALVEPLDRNIAILFGDGAGACLIGSEPGGLEIIDSVLHSDGTFADDLRLEFSGPVRMNGRSVILQATRRIPAAINEVLVRQSLDPANIRAFLLHQANQNLLDRVAKALAIPPARFFSNIHNYGNTSSASLFIAASEWSEQESRESGQNPGHYVCFAAFGAGFHWGALLARYCKY
jgi:3-oxoacyl-[acyl-carrier-protein] synthase-3